MKNNIFSKNFWMFMLLISLIIEACSSSNTNNDHVRIAFVALSTHCSIPVNCELFEYHYKKPLAKEIILTKEDIIKQINNHILALIPSLEATEDKLDIRIKCYIMRGSKVDTICISTSHQIICNGQLMKPRNKFIKLIYKQVYPEVDTAKLKCEQYIKKQLYRIFLLKQP